MVNFGIIWMKGVMMQTIQFKVDSSYLNIILTLLNNLKKDIVKELSIFDDVESFDKKHQIKRFDREDTLSKFMEIDKSIRCNEKAQAFLELGGSGCWVGSLDEIRGDRIDYGIGR